jgi:hypothetical protein
LNSPASDRQEPRYTHQPTEACNAADDGKLGMLNTLLLLLLLLLWSRILLFRHGMVLPIPTNQPFHALKFCTTKCASDVYDVSSVT